MYNYNLSQAEFPTSASHASIYTKRLSQPEIEDEDRRGSQPEVKAGNRRRSSIMSVISSRRQSYPSVMISGAFGTKASKDNKSQYIKQITYGMIVASATMTSGIMIARPAAFPKLTEEERSELQLTQESEGFLIPSVFISGMLMNLITGFLLELLGPRTLVLMALLPAISSYITQALVLNIWVLFTCRLVVGCMSSVIVFACTPLLAELCNPKIRGFLLSFPEISNSLGLLYAYVSANHLTYRLMTGLCALPPFLTFLAMFLVPESPYWLVSKGRLDKSEKSMKNLYGKDYEKPLMEIQDNIKPHSKFSDQMKALRLPCNYAPVLLVLSLFVLKVLAGQMFIFSYAGHLFEESDIPIDSSWCPILIGTTRLIFTFVSASIIDYGGRRPLLLSSAMVCGLSLVSAGLATYFDHHILCIASVLVFAASFSLGEGPIVPMLAGELVPLAVRSQGMSIIITSFYLVSFCTTLIYQIVLNRCGLGVVLYICAFFNLVMFIVALIFLPETRNASLCDMKNAYEKHRPSIVEAIEITDIK